ncbi:hypothetical protein VIGAN_02113800 [Vigna angularis var. angularis]|uniref:Uncharacterized protein n=1 Tax=Vigna angularis var. angularis TaxID=157739 RepID=A0A0S3RD90_PHAAN|nr:hypothetical protein VIGAN_02113800 [Vigna angularis var. angularis]
MRPFNRSLYWLNPSSTFTPSETGSFSATGGRNTPDPDPELPFFDFRFFRSSAFFPVPLRYRRRSWLMRLSKSSSEASGSGSEGSEPEGGVSGSVARRTKRRRGLGLEESAVPKFLSEACQLLLVLQPYSDLK